MANKTVKNEGYIPLQASWIGSEREGLIRSEREETPGSPVLSARYSSSRCILFVAVSRGHISGVVSSMNINSYVKFLPNLLNHK